jgi:hypothetical protein
MKQLEKELEVLNFLNNNKMIIAFVKNKYKFLLGLGVYLLITTNCLADPGDGNCDDNNGGPDGCPLDTWVIILVIIAVTFTAMHLYRKQKSLQAFKP